MGIGGQPEREREKDLEGTKGHHLQLFFALEGGLVGEMLDEDLDVVAEQLVVAHVGDLERRR